MIKQSELAAFLKLRDKAAKAKEAVEKAKDKLVEGLPDGIERGPYGLKVETRESQRFSYTSLVEAIGRLQTDRIKALLPLSSSTVVTVTAP